MNFYIKNFYFIKRKLVNFLMNKQLYIGLNGLAGSGKDTVAKMIRVILGHKNLSLEECMSIYKEHYYNPWISATFSSPTDDSHNVFSIAFADQLKTICSTIFGIPVERFYQNKATAWICVNKDFKYTEIKPDDSQIMTADEYYYAISEVSKPESEPKWMSLREILVYVGTYILQQDINKQIFVNIVSNIIKEQILKNKDLEYVIVTDIRFMHEIEFLRKHNGIAINIVRDGIKALDNVAEHDLDNEDCWDYVIENNGTYEELFSKVYNLIHGSLEFNNETIELNTHENVNNYLRCYCDFGTCMENGEETHQKGYELCTQYPVQSIAHTDGDISMLNPVGGPSIFLNQSIDCINTDNKIVPIKIGIIGETNNFAMVCKIY